MLNFLKQTIIFGCILTAILCLLGHITDSGLRKSEVDNFSEWNDIYKGIINADMIIAGSSRAWVHVSPFILDSTLHLNSYNLGLDGHNFQTQYVRHKFYEKYNTRPATIIYCIDLFTLSPDNELFMPEQFAPYLHDSIIREGIKNHQGFSTIDFFNPFTKYLFNYRHIAIGFLEFFDVKHFKSEKYKGFKAKDKKWDNSFERAKMNRPNGWTVPMDQKLISAFESYLRECKQKGIKVILVYTPEYVEGQKLIKNRHEIIAMYQKLSKSHGIPFFDYSGDKICGSKHYFYNSQHLNRQGAELFSVQLASDLKKHLHPLHSDI